MDERVLAERLITYDTSTLDGLRAAAGFVKGWLESRELEVKSLDHDGLPVVMVDVGARNLRTRRRSSCMAISTSCRRTPRSSSPGSRATGSSAAAPTT